MHHHCECKHENIKFCKKCQRPYCVDCGQEWYEQSLSYTYPYYTITSETHTNPTDAGTTWIDCGAHLHSCDRKGI